MSFEDSNDLHSKYVSNKPDKFYFQQRRGQLDIRNLAKLNIERIIEDVDVYLLQSFLENITFSSIAEKDLKYLTDPILVKFFRIAQLIIEYLLYAQEQLVQNVHSLATKWDFMLEKILHFSMLLIIAFKSYIAADQ